MSHPTRHAARPAGVRHFRLYVEVLDDGRLRLSCPEARGAALVSRGALQTWSALHQIRNEASIAGYSMWRGVRYDLDELTDPTDPTEPRRRRPHTRREAEGDRSEVSYSQDGVVRPDQAHPAEWTPNPDGSWSSPKGRRYTDPKKINSLLINRARMGLPTSYAEWVEHTGAAV